MINPRCSDATDDAFVDLELQPELTGHLCFALKHIAYESIQAQRLALLTIVNLQRL